MKILHVNFVDLSGRRFNGYDLTDDLVSRGFSGKQAVLSKLSKNANVVSFITSPADWDFQNALEQVEDRHSMRNLLYPWGRVLAGMPEFRDADVVHYHQIHNGVISLLDLPRLCALKPSVWTFHDPWPITGHCVYPLVCEGWLDRCSPCPYPELLFPMREDCAGRMWNIKRRIYSEIDIDVVVASEFMLDMIRRSPFASDFEHAHLIPFGIDASAYLPDEAKSASRKSLGIAQEDFVVLFRSTDSPFKGLPSIIEALVAKPPARPTTLLTVERRGRVSRLANDYRVLELGWVENPALYARILSACDVLLMPSTAEAFGMMALEAMAAGRTVISFDGTAVPALTHAPDCGIAVPMRDAASLRQALDLLATDGAEVERRGRLGRSIAVDEYRYTAYLDAVAAMYRTVYERQRSGGN